MGLGQLTYIDVKRQDDKAVIVNTFSDKLEVAIALLKAWEPLGGYYFADSGGACSSATLDILQRNDIKHDAHHCVSPIDPPIIREFLKQYHPDTQWDYHAKGFWKMVQSKGLPMRNRRWCCEVIKEAGGDNRVVVVGNRRAEGNIRSKQCFVETPEQRMATMTKRGFKPKKSTKTFLRPIIEFTDSDLWQYIREHDVPYLSLYDEGTDHKGYGEGIFKRMGCVLCPFARNIESEEEYFPEIVKLWKLACERLTVATKERGYLNKRGKPVKHRFEPGTDQMYDWWVARK